MTDMILKARMDEIRKQQKLESEWMRTHLNCTGFFGKGMKTGLRSQSWVPGIRKHKKS